MEITTYLEPIINNMIRITTISDESHYPVAILDLLSEANVKNTSIELLS